MRSPFLPDILAQSSGLVEFGKSSFSRNSSRQAEIKCATLIPFLLLDKYSLIAAFFARETIFSSIAPLEKSLKYKTSLSPLT